MEPCFECGQKRACVGEFALDRGQARSLQHNDGQTSFPRYSKFCLGRRAAAVLADEDIGLLRIKERAFAIERERSPRGDDSRA